MCLFFWLIPSSMNRLLAFCLRFFHHFSDRWVMKWMETKRNILCAYKNMMNQQKRQLFYYYRNFFYFSFFTFRFAFAALSTSFSVRKPFFTFIITLLIIINMYTLQQNPVYLPRHIRPLELCEYGLSSLFSSSLLFQCPRQQHRRVGEIL